MEGWPHRRCTGHWQVGRRRCFWKALFSFLVAFPSCSIDIKTFSFFQLYAHLDQNASSEACTLLHKRLNSSRRPLCNGGRRKLSHQDHLTWSDWMQPIASHISNHWMKLSKQFTTHHWMDVIVRILLKRQIISGLGTSHSSPWIILALGDFWSWHICTVLNTKNFTVIRPNH